MKAREHTQQRWGTGSSKVSQLLMVQAGENRAAECPGSKRTVSLSSGMHRKGSVFRLSSDTALLGPLQDIQPTFTVGLLMYVADTA